MGEIKGTISQFRLDSAGSSRRSAASTFTPFGTRPNSPRGRLPFRRSQGSSQDQAEMPSPNHGQAPALKATKKTEARLKCNKFEISLGVQHCGALADVRSPSSSDFGL